MKHPYERFLRFLVSRKKNVQRALERIGLPFKDELLVPRIGCELRGGAPRQIVRYLDSPSNRIVIKEGFLEWAETHGIRVLWEQTREFCAGEPDGTVSLASSLFFDRVTRRTLGLLLLCRLPLAEVAQAMKERFGFEVPAATVRHYANIYWDRREASDAFWKDLLGQMDPTEGHDYAIGLQWPPPSLNEIREYLGIATKVDPIAAMEEVLAASLRGYHEARQATTAQTGQEIMVWIERVERAATRLLAARGGQGEKGEPKTGAPHAFTQFSLIPERTRFRTMEDLEREISQPPRLSEGR